jgi:8-oxo-dGTP diphosphatase
VIWHGRRIGAAAVIVDDGGRVLLVRHTYGHLNWEIPGGASDPGESVTVTALRELREETGLEAVAETMTGVYWQEEANAHHFVFRCTPVDGREPMPSSSEISECGYFSPDDPPRPISDFTLRRIRDALSNGGGPLPVAVPPRTWLE